MFDKQLLYEMSAKLVTYQWLMSNKILPISILHILHNSKFLPQLHKQLYTQLKWHVYTFLQHIQLFSMFSSKPMLKLYWEFGFGE